MKSTLKRTLAVIMAVIMIFSAAFIPAYAKSPIKIAKDVVSEYEYRYHYGYNIPTMKEILNVIEVINATTETLMGFKLFDGEKLVFRAEGFVDDIFTELAETTFFDGYALANNLIFPNKSSQAVIDLFQIDVDKVVSELAPKVDECFRNGETVKGVFIELIIIYFRQLKEVNVKEVKVSDTLYRIDAEIVYNHGGTDVMALDFYYDTEKQLCYNSEDKGMVYLGFNFDRKGSFMYSAVNPWQQKFGFRLLYDFIANIVIMDYNTERVKFTYNDKEWMIQFWKGRYAILPGGEVGIYNRPIGSKGSYYDCAVNDQMNMSIEIYHEDELLLSNGPMMHWWITGFYIGQKYYLPESLTIKGTIEFPNEEMATLFTNAANKHKRLHIEQDGVMTSYVFDSYIKL